MKLTVFKSKIHRATVTQADLHYEGSIGVDSDLLKASNILPYEQVDVLNITNGNRFTTYAIAEPAGSGVIQINGAAAHLAAVGDMVIVIAYASMKEKKAKMFKPTVVVVDNKNKVKH
jgi:aspartate 1-decarboxylase